jgi:hypothetical protein
MSGTIVQMAASHPSQLYQIPGGSGTAYEAASENAESVPAPVGGRRRRHTKKASRRHHKKTAKKTAGRRHRKSRK